MKTKQKSKLTFTRPSKEAIAKLSIAAIIKRLNTATQADSAQAINFWRGQYGARLSMNADKAKAGKAGASARWKR